MILWKDCQNYEKKSGQDMSKDTFSKNVGISVILDSGVLIVFLADTDYSSKILDLTFDNNSILNFYLTPLTLMEVYYILRELMSQTIASEKLEQLNKLVKTIDITFDLIKKTSELKFLLHISYADCLTLAYSHAEGIKAVFKHEKEIDKQLDSLLNVKNEDIDQALSTIVFIDDFMS